MAWIKILKWLSYIFLFNYTTFRSKTLPHAFCDPPTTLPVSLIQSCSVASYTFQYHAFAKVNPVQDHREPEPEENSVWKFNQANSFF